ncbi:MAG: GtrA family protein [Chloroflexi bacterium]|nr:GtrA family protein [Chloroflexota bacterium]
MKSMGQTVGTAIQPERSRWGKAARRMLPIQALKFLAIGVLNTLVDGALYFALTRWWGLAALPALAKGLSYSAGVLNSFHWNRSWTFKSEASGLRALLPFVLANLIALAINAGVMQVCLQVIWGQLRRRAHQGVWPDEPQGRRDDPVRPLRAGQHGLRRQQLRGQRRRHGHGPGHRADVDAG